MTVRFAPARTAARSPIVRALPATALPANDNGGDDVEVLRAALHHFAIHGLGAARAAYAAGEGALASGNRTEAARWRAICRALDRRLGARLERLISAQPIQPTTQSR